MTKEMSEMKSEDSDYIHIEETYDRGSEITVTTLRHLISSSNQNDSNLSNDCPPDRKSSTVVAVQGWIPKNFPSWATT